MKPSLLKVERRLREWSQAEVAEAVGVSIKTVSRWEQGQAVPHPYYRNKLLTLFDKTAEELGLLSDTDEELDEAIPEVTLLVAQSATPDIQMPTSFLDDPAILPKEELDLSSDVDRNETIPEVTPPMAQSISPNVPNFFSRPTLNPSKILLTLIAIIVIQLAFILQPLFHSTYLGLPSLKSASPTSTSTKSIYSSSSYRLTIQNTDPSLADATQRFRQAFNAVYPQLVNRFALNPAHGPRNVTLIFTRDIPPPSLTSGTTIRINPDWIRQYPNDVGLLTHELTLVVEQYPSGAPDWFAHGMADYARSVYGPADDDDWSLPDGVQPQDNYLHSSTRVVARFLLWLEQHTALDIVDQLNHALQRGQAFSAVFNHLTHYTVDELWSQYQHHPNLIQTPEQLYKTVTSRKPLYRRSSFDLQVSHPGWRLFIIPGLSVSNVAIQADMTIIHGDVGGLIFRWNTTQSDASKPSYRFHLHSAADSTFGTFDLANQNNRLTFGWNSAIKQGYNQTNRLTIIAQKHIIYLYINGQFITQVDDSISSYGKVAAMALDNSNPTDIRFDNIQVF